MPAISLPSLSMCFAPVVDRGVRLLILGSLPGVASLAAQQYYAHPRNRFWELMSAIIGAELRPLPYDERLKTLLAHRIGLWDVIAQAERPGSLDAAIRNEVHNPLAELAGSLPRLRAVGFNGGTSARHGHRLLKGLAQELALIDLPSSSAALTMPFERKRAAWLRLREYVVPAA